MCIRSYLTSVLSYKFVILDTCHTDIVYLLSKDVRIRDYFEKLKVAASNKVLETLK